MVNYKYNKNHRRKGEQNMSYNNDNREITIKINNINQSCIKDWNYHFVKVFV